MRRLSLVVLLLGVAACVPGESLLQTSLGPDAVYSVATPAEQAAGTDRFPVQVAGRWGYIDRTGAMVIEPRFDSARPFRQGRAAAGLDGVWGLIDPDGQYVAVPAWDAVGDVADGRARVTLRRSDVERFGFVDADGAVVVTPNLIAAYDFSGGLAPAQAVRRDAPLGIPALRAIGQPVASDWLLVGADGRVRAEVDADAVASGAAAPSGAVLFPFSRAAGPFNGPTWGWLAADGREVIAPRFQAVGGFAQGLAPAAEGGLFGFVDESGTFQTAPRFEVALPFSDGWARVMDAGKWGFVRADGTLATPIQWDGALDASDGLAAVQRGALWGYLGTDSESSGALAIPLRYTFATPFHSGLARVRDAGGDAYIDTEGTVVWRGE